MYLIFLLLARIKDVYLPCMVSIISLILHSHLMFQRLWHSRMYIFCVFFLEFKTRQECIERKKGKKNYYDMNAVSENYKLCSN